MRNFSEMLKVLFEEKRFVCIGLDLVESRLPRHLCHRNREKNVYEFLTAIIDATKDVAAAFKPNDAFFGPTEFLGTWNHAQVLKEVILYARHSAPCVPWIGDIKRGDTQDTNEKHARTAFEYYDFDAVTVHHYMGKQAMLPFLEYKNKGVFVVCRSSNPGADQFQDVLVATRGSNTSQRENDTKLVPYYQQVAQVVAEDWNEYGNCGLVVGATVPDQLRNVRAIAPNLSILCPGIGIQGGSVEDAYRAGCDAQGSNILLSASRSIIYASDGTDFAQAAYREATRLTSRILTSKKNL